MKHLLFPHIVQKIVIGVLLTDIVLLIVVLLSGTGLNPISVGLTGQSALLIVFYLAVFFCVFSKESVEDEKTSSLRLKSLSLVSLVGLAIVIILNIIQLLLPYGSDSYLAVKEWRMNHFWNSNFYVNLAILYLIILKVSIRLKGHKDDRPSTHA